MGKNLNPDILLNGKTVHVRVTTFGLWKYSDWNEILKKTLHWQTEYRREMWFSSNDQNSFSFHSPFRLHMPLYSTSSFSFLLPLESIPILKTTVIQNILLLKKQCVCYTYYAMGFTFDSTMLSTTEVLCVLKKEQWHLFVTIILCSWNCERQYNKR